MQVYDCLGWPDIVAIKSIIRDKVFRVCNHDCDQSSSANGYEITCCDHTIKNSVRAGTYLTVKANTT